MGELGDTLLACVRARHIEKMSLSTASCRDAKHRYSLSSLWCLVPSN
jgi:hypothetical protein